MEEKPTFLQFTSLLYLAFCLLPLSNFSSSPHQFLIKSSKSISSSAKDTQQLQEQIDKIKIEIQCCNYCNTTIFISLVCSPCSEHDSLCVIGCQSQKDCNPNQRSQKVQCARMQEKVQQACNKNANESHHKIACQSIQIAFCCCPIQPHQCKHQRTSEKDIDNGTLCKHKIYGRKCQAIHKRI